MAALVIAGLLVAGCVKKSGQANMQALDQAAPEIKADWDVAVAADKTNDYFTASIAYAKVIRQETKLTPKQFDTVLTASHALSQRLMAAAESGDPAAKQALVQLMQAQNRH